MIRIDPQSLLEGLSGAGQVAGNRKQRAEVGLYIGILGRAAGCFAKTGEGVRYVLLLEINGAECRLRLRVIGLGCKETLILGGGGVQVSVCRQVRGRGCSGR